MPPRLRSFAPQFLVDDLARSIAYYRDVLGFAFGESWGGFYVIGSRDGFDVHLKEAPKNPAERRHRREHEHLDAYADVDGIDAFYDRCVAHGAKILKPLAATPWETKDFYLEDPDGYILSFGGTTAGSPATTTHRPGARNRPLGRDLRQPLGRSTKEVSDR